MGSSGAVVRVRPAGGDFAESLGEERASEQGHRFVVCTELLAPVAEDCVERAGDAERGRHRPRGALRRSASGPARSGRNVPQFPHLRPGDGWKRSSSLETLPDPRGALGAQVSDA